MRKASKKTPSGEKRSEHFTPPKCFKLSHHCAVSTDFFLLSSFLFCSFFLAVFKGFPKNYFSLLKSCQSANRLLFQKKKKKKSCFLSLSASATHKFFFSLLLPVTVYLNLSEFFLRLPPALTLMHHTHSVCFTSHLPWCAAV